MTSQQQEQLNNAWNDYQSKIAAFQAAEAEYIRVNIPQADAGFSAAIITPARQRKEAGKIAMETALAAYNTLKDTIEKQEQAAFNAANPTAAVQIAQTQAQAAADTASAQALGKAKEVETLAKAEIESQAAVFAAKNKQVILWGGVIVLVIVVFGVVYLKFVRKQKP